MDELVSGLYLTVRLTRGNIIETICRIGDTNKVLPVKYYNWMYAVPNPGLGTEKILHELTRVAGAHSPAQIRFEVCENMVFSSSHAAGDVLKDRVVQSDAIRVYYAQPANAFIKKTLENLGCCVYEAAVPLEWRFLCSTKLSLFCPIAYSARQTKMWVGEPSGMQLNIPACIFLANQPKMYFLINTKTLQLQHTALVFDDANVAMWFCWGTRDMIPSEGGMLWNGQSNQCLVQMRNAVLNLLDVHANRNAGKQIMHPMDFAAFETRQFIDTNVIKELIQGVLGIATQIPCSLNTLTLKKSKKTLADAILFSRCRPNTIVEPPEPLQKYESKAIIIKRENFAAATEQEEIWLLDFVSHYPNIILALAERCPRLAHVAATLVHFLRLKGNASGMLKTVYKLLLNAVGYGTMGISTESAQHFSRSMIEINAQVCQISHDIMESAIKVFESANLKIMHVHTDSLAARGQPQILQAAMDRVNQLIREAVPRLSYTTLELKEKIHKIAIFNKTDMFYIRADAELSAHGIGHWFNSITIPEFCRRQITFDFRKALLDCTSYMDFFAKYVILQRQLRDAAQLEIKAREKRFVPLRQLVVYAPLALLHDTKGDALLEKVAKERWARANSDGGHSSDYYVCLTGDIGLSREDIPFEKIARFGIARGLPNYTSLLTLTFTHKRFLGYVQNLARQNS